MHLDSKKFFDFFNQFQNKSFTIRYTANKAILNEWNINWKYFTSHIRFYPKNIFQFLNFDIVIK